MSDILPFLKSILSVSGLSGYESPAAQLIEQKWTPLVDTLTRSALGSLHGLKKGQSTSNHRRADQSPRPTVLIAAHMDAIGLMVARIVGELLYITSIGGVDPRVLPGTPVLVHASNGDDLPGVVVMPHANLLPDGEGSGALPLKYLMVDTGLLAKDVARRINVGDRVSFNTQPIDLAGECISGHSLDNRASVAALTICLEELQSKFHYWEVWALASVQEEVSFGGAFTSTFDLRPTIAVAVDVTFGQGTGSSGWQTFPIGKGVTLGISPSVHPYLHQQFKKVADQLEIPASNELMPEYSSTDADAMQLTAEGIPTMVLSIPQRYMHTPVELVSVKDIQRAGRLLAGFISSLEEDFMDKMNWDN